MHYIPVNLKAENIDLLQQNVLATRSAKEFSQ